MNALTRKTSTGFIHCIPYETFTNRYRHVNLLLSGNYFMSKVRRYIVSKHCFPQIRQNFSYIRATI